MKQSTIISLFLLAALLWNGTGTRGQQTGLSVIIEPGWAAIQPGEAVALRMTFRNTSSERFRLPDQINPPPYNFWYLKLRNTGTGKNYTGISTRPMGAAPEPGEITPAVLRNGETKTVSVTFTAFAFVEGDMDFQAARNIWFPSRLDNQSSFALPAGAYDIRVMVRFRSSPDRAAIANDPVPFWKGAEVLSSSTSIKVSSDAEPTRAEIIQIARDRAISALDFLAVGQLDSDFVSTRNHSGL